MTPTRRGERGATLLELVVAVAAGAVVLGALTHVVVRVADARERTMRRLAVATAAEALLARLAAEVEAVAVLGREPGLRLAATPEGTVLDLVTTLVADAPADDVRRVRWEHTPRAVRRIERSRFAPDGTPGDTVTMLGDVTVFRLETFDGRAWHGAWAARRPPRAVRASFTVETGDGITETFGTTILVPTAGGR